MVIFRQTLCALMLILFTGVAFAQNNTNSPYTRYGYGDLSNQGFGNSRAMGGIAYGLRSSYQINPLNPASYTAVDSLTFLFEGGISVQNDNMSDGIVKLNVKNSSLDYLALQFRLFKKLAFTGGLLPYSNVGYNVAQTFTQTPSSPAYTKQVSGEGGLHQAFVGLGYRVFENLSIGINGSFMWGDISRSLVMIYPSYPSVSGSGSTSPSYTEYTNTQVRSYKLDFGVQYTQPIGEKHKVILGAVFSPGHSLNNNSYLQTATSVINKTDTVAKFEIPDTYGAGFTYIYDDRITVGLDYTYQNWGDVTYFNQKNAFCDRTKISVGAEYLPSRTAKSYFGLVRYRVGGYYSTPYYKAENGERASREFGVTAGLGLPVPRSRSMVSITGQFVRVKGLQPGMVSENVLKLSVGLTFNEIWFFKRKVD